MGYRKIIMNREGNPIHKNIVRRYMRDMGIMAIYPSPNLSKRNRQHSAHSLICYRNLRLRNPIKFGALLSSIFA